MNKYNRLTRNQYLVIKHAIITATDSSVDQDAAMQELVMAINNLTDEEYRFFSDKAREEIKCQQK